MPQGHLARRSLVTLEFGDASSWSREPSTLLHRSRDLRSDRVRRSASTNEFENCASRHPPPLTSRATHTARRRDRQGPGQRLSQALGQHSHAGHQAIRVEVLVAEVGDGNGAKSEILHILYDARSRTSGTTRRCGQSDEDSVASSRTTTRTPWTLGEALQLACAPCGHAKQTLTERDLEVAVLDRNKARRKFADPRGGVVNSWACAVAVLGPWQDRPMKRRIFGIENEYGLTCTLNGQRRLSPATSRVPLREGHSGATGTRTVFLENGARLYLDTDSTRSTRRPSGDDVTELVIHDKAGERIVEDLLHQPRTAAARTGSRATSSCSRTTPTRRAIPTAATELPSRGRVVPAPAEALIPFFVTRQIFRRARARCCRRRALPLLPVPARSAHLPGNLRRDDLVAVDHQHARPSRTPTPSGTGACT